MPAVKRRRGRPPARWFRLEELAARIGGDPDRMAAMLDKVPEALPGAELDDSGAWRVPERALKGLLGVRGSAGLPRLATVAEVAQCLRRSVQTTLELVKLEGPRGERILRGRKILGEWRIEVDSVLTLPDRLPAWAAAARAPSFFRDRGDSADG